MAEESPEDRERLLLELLLAQQKVIGVNCRFLTHTRAGKGVTLSQIAYLDDSAASKSVNDKVILPRCKTINKAVVGLMDVCVQYSTTYPKTELGTSIRALGRKLKRSVMQILHHVLNPEKDALKQQNTIIAAYMQLTTHSSALRRLVVDRMEEMEEGDQGSGAKLRTLTPSSLEVKVGSSKDTMEHRIKQILARVYQFAYSLEGLTEQLKCFYDVRDRMEAFDDGKTEEERRERIRVALEEENIPFEELERDLGWEELQFVATNRRTVEMARQKVLRNSDSAQSDLAEVACLLRAYAMQQWPHAEYESRDELLNFWALISEMRLTASQYIHGLRRALLSEESKVQPSSNEETKPPVNSDETPIPDTMKNRMSVKFHLNDWEGRMQLLKLETMQLAEQQRQVVVELEQVQQHRQLATMQLKGLQQEEAAILAKQLQMHRAAAVRRTRREQALKAKQEVLSRMDFAISQTEQILRINNIRLLRHEQQLTQKIEQLQQQLELGHRRQLQESFDDEAKAVADASLPASPQLSSSPDTVSGSPPATATSETVKHPALSKANLSAQLEKLRERHRRPSITSSSSGSLSEGTADIVTEIVRKSGPQAGAEANNGEGETEEAEEKGEEIEKEEKYEEKGDEIEKEKDEEEHEEKEEKEEAHKEEEKECEALLTTSTIAMTTTPATMTMSCAKTGEARATARVKALDEKPPFLREIVAEATNSSNSSVTRHVAKSQAKLKQLEAEQAVLRHKQMVHIQQMQVHELHREKLRVLQGQVQRLEADVSEEDNSRPTHTQVLAKREQSETQEVKQRQYGLLHSMRKMKFAEAVLVERIGNIQARLVEHKEFLNAMLKDRVAAETARRKHLLKRQLQQQQLQQRKEEEEEQQQKRQQMAESVAFGQELLQCHKRFSSSFQLVLESMIAKLKEEAIDSDESSGGGSGGSQEDVNIWQERQITTGEGRTVVFADSSGSGGGGGGGSGGGGEQPLVVKAGTLNQLVIQLTDEKRHDLNFVKTFITTFSSFTTPEILFKKLVERYEVPKAQSGDVSEAQWKQNVVLPIQLRVFNVLKIWLDTRFSDFDYKLLKMLNDFIDNHCRRDGHAKMAKNLSSLVKRKINQAMEEQEREEKEVAIVGGASGATAVDSSKAAMSPTVRMAKVDQLNGMSEEVLAKCLTAIEFSNFRRIEPQELLNQAWTKAKYRYKARNVLRMIDNFNMVSRWVALSICCPERLRARTAALVRFIRLAQYLHEPLHNFSTLMAVLAGISSSAVHRLKFTAEDVPRKWREVLEGLQALMSSTKSYKSYRAALQRASPPAVPYTGIWLTDLVFIDDGNANTVGGAGGGRLINFRKREMTYRIIEEVQQYGQTTYPFAARLDRAALDLVAHLPTMSEEELWDLSQKREPRGKDRSELVQ